MVVHHLTMVLVSSLARIVELWLNAIMKRGKIGVRRPTSYIDTNSVIAPVSEGVLAKFGAYHILDRRGLKSKKYYILAIVAIRRESLCCSFSLTIGDARPFV